MGKRASTLRSHHFRKEADVRFAKSNIDNFLLETSKVRFVGVCTCMFAWLSC